MQRPPMDEPGVPFLAKATGDARLVSRRITYRRELGIPPRDDRPEPPPAPPPKLGPPRLEALEAKVDRLTALVERLLDYADADWRLDELGDLEELEWGDEEEETP